MMSLTNLNDYKKEKLNKRLTDDITKILHILDTTQKALSFFKQYKPVQELISVIETHKTLLEIKKRRHEATIQKDKKTDPIDDKDR